MWVTTPLNQADYAYDSREAHDEETHDEKTSLTKCCGGEDVMYGSSTQLSAQ